MTKKDFLSKKDKKDWQEFIKDTTRLPDKDKQHYKRNISRGRYKFDLHGLSLDEANKRVKETINFCFENKYREILMITGKGLHSSDEDVYKSSKLSKLRYSVPNFINNDPEISNLVSDITNPPDNEGGEGAILIRLRKL